MGAPGPKHPGPGTKRAVCGPGKPGSAEDASEHLANAEPLSKGQWQGQNLLEVHGKQAQALPRSVCASML